MSTFFAGPLCDKYGYRKVAVVGGLMCFTSIILTIFAKSPIHLFFTISVLNGKL